MPPTTQTLNNEITKALLDSTTPVFREKDDNGNPTDDLPEPMKAMVQCIAEGVFVSLQKWQATGTQVIVPGVTSGTSAATGRIIDI